MVLGVVMMWWWCCCCDDWGGDWSVCVVCACGVGVDVGIGAGVGGGLSWLWRWWWFDLVVMVGGVGSIGCCIAKQYVPSSWEPCVTVVQMTVATLPFSLSSCERAAYG